MLCCSVASRPFCCVRCLWAYVCVFVFVWPFSSNRESHYCCHRQTDRQTGEWTSCQHDRGQVTRRTDRRWHHLADCPLSNRPSDRWRHKEPTDETETPPPPQIDVRKLWHCTFLRLELFPTSFHQMAWKDETGGREEESELWVPKNKNS